MKRPQFSILGLFGLTAFVAIACTSLVSANDYWVAGLFTATSATLSMAILLCIFRRGSAQAFWLGFAIIGWLYWLALCWEAPTAYELARNGIHTDFVTSRVLNWTYETVLPRVRTPPPPTMGGGGFFGPGGGGSAAGGGERIHIVIPALTGGGGVESFVGIAAVGGGAAINTYPERDTFLRVGQPLWTLLLAFLGGRVAVYLDAARREPRSISR